MAILPALDHQLRVIREVEGDFSVTHIDTCLPSFLGDHHNRDGELLLGVQVDGATSLGEVLEGLADEFRAIGWELGESREGFDYDKAAQAIRDFRQSALESDASAPFDPSLEILSPDDWREGGEPCQAWFLIHWEVEPS